MRPAHRRLAALSALFALSLLSCGREVTGPDDGFQYGRPRRAALALDPQMPSLFASLEGAGDVIAFERVRVVLRNEAGVVVYDSLVDFPAGADSVALTVTLPIPIDAPEAGLPLSLTMAYVNAAGDTVFRGGPAPVVAAPLGSSGASQPITIPIVYDGVGKNATSVVLTPAADTVFAGTSSTFTAIARDASNATIPLTPILFYTLDSARASVPNVGVGSVTWLPSRGIARIVAALPDGQPSDTSYVLVNLPASQLVLGSGGGQSGTFGVPLANPIVVRTLASDNVPVQGVEVVFAVTTGGGSVATLVDTSDANGDVSTSWTLGSTIGAQTITATAAGLTGSPLTITATATAGAPFRVLVTQQPIAATAGQTLAPSVVATVQDNAGNTVSTFTGPVTVVLDTGVAGALNGTTTRNAVAGVATFDDLSLTAVGFTRLIASSGALIADESDSIAVVPGATSRLEIVAEPTNAVAGTVIVPPVVVMARDAFGNPTPAFSGSVSIGVLTGTPGAILSGIVTLSATAGVATYSNLSLDKIGSYTLLVSSSGLVPDTTVAFSVGAGTPATLEILSGDAQAGTVGLALSQPLVVRVRDAFGNRVPNATVIFSAVNGSIAPDTTVADTAGVATGSWTLGPTVGAQAASATSPGATPVNFTATAGPSNASYLQVETQPQDTMTAGAAAAAITVSVRDAFGNLVTGFSGNVDLGLSFNPAGGSVIAGPLAAATSAGVATFNGVTLDKSGRYVFVFTVPALTPAFTDTVQVIAGAADTIVMVDGNNQTGEPNSTLGAPMRVRVFDALGNPVEGLAVTWTVASGDANTTITTVFTDSTGLSQTELVVHDSVGAVVVHATAAGVGGSPVVFTHTVQSLAPTVINLSAPTLGTAGAILGAFAVELRDAQNNLAAAYTDTVRVVVLAGPAAAPTGGKVKAVPVGGLVSFDDLVFSTRGAYQLAIIAAGVADSAFVTVTIEAANANAIALAAGDGQTAAVQAVLPTPLQVLVTDIFGNPKPGVNVSWGVFSGDASVSAPTTVTDTNGVASVTVTLGTTPGAVQIQASQGALAGSPITFNATATAGAAVRLLVETQPVGAAAGDTLAAFSVSARDSIGNLVTDFTGVVSVLVDSGPVGAVLFGAPSVNAVGGIATFDAHYLTIAGVHRLGFLSGGLADTTSNDITITAGAAALVALVDGNSQTDTVTRTLAAPMRARVTDQFNNAIAGHAVAWTVASGDALVGNDTTFTDAAGIASVLLTFGDSADTVIVHAASSGLIGSPVVFTHVAVNDTLAALVVQAAPDSVVAGAALPSIVIRAVDAYGNTVADYTGDITVSVNDGPGAFASGTTTQAAVAGVAIFDDLHLNVAGNYTLGATSGAESAVLLVVVTEAAATTFEFASQPFFSTAGDVLGPITVVARDAFGNLAASFDSVTIAVDSSAVDAVLTGTLTLSGASGSAVFNDLRLNRSGLTRFRAEFAGLGGAISDTLRQVAGAPESIALYDGTGQVGTVNSVLANPLQVIVFDSLGNGVPGVNVVWAVDSGLATLNDSSIDTDSLGFSSAIITLGDSIGAVWISATLGGVSGSPVQFVLGALNAPAVQLSIDVDPSPAIAGQLMAPIAVSARDSLLNYAVDYAGTIDVAIDSGPVGAVLSGTTSVAAGAGIAVFTDLSLDLIGNYRLRFTASGLTDTIVTIVFPISAATATDLALVDGEAQSDTVTRALNNPLRVRVTDGFGNGVAGQYVQWAVTSGSATVGADSTATDAGGYAEAVLTLGTTAGGVTVDASVAGLTGSPITFTATAVEDTVTQIVVVTSPDTVQSGAFATYDVQARDAYGNVVTSCVCPVDVAVAGPAALVAGTTSLNFAGGAISFSDLVFGTIGTYTLVFTSGAFVDTVTTEVIAGAGASFVLVSGHNQSGMILTSLDSALVVRIQDAQGNGRQGDTVVFSVTLGAGLLGGGLTASDTVITDADGYASTTWQLGALVGTQSVTASATGFSDLGFDATATMLIANVVWTGNTDGDWTNAANWKNGITPTSADSVLIPAGRPNYPVLTGNAGMDRLTIEDGATFNMNGWDIIVTRKAVVPSTLAFTAGGAFYMNGGTGGEVQGAFTSLGIMNGSYAATGAVSTADNLRVFSNGSFNFGPAVHSIGTDLQTETGGTIAQSSGGVIDVFGNVSLTGGSTSGQLTGGTIGVAGDFTTGGDPASFAADSAHLVVFNGPATQTVTLGSPDATFAMSCASSCFGTVQSTKGAGAGALIFAGDVKALGGFLIGGDSLGASGVTLVAGGPSNFDAAVSTTHRVGWKETLARGAGFSGDTLFAWGDNGDLGGDLDVTTVVVGTRTHGNSSPSSAAVIVDGALHINGITEIQNDLITRGTGRVWMQDASDTLYVWGNFTAGSDIGPSDTTFAAGFLQLSNSLLQTNAGAVSVRSSANHTTRFMAVSPSLSTAHPGNSLGSLTTSSLTTLNVSGSLDVMGSVTIEGASGGSVTGGTEDTLTVHGSLTDAGGGRWLVGATKFTGLGISLPDSIAVDVVITGSWSPAFNVITGDLHVRGAGQVFIGGSLQVQNVFVRDNANIEMDAATDSLFVSGTFDVNSGTVTPLNAGYLEIHGDFVQAGSGSVIGQPAHSTWFKGPANSNITFAAPGFGGGESSFGELYLAKGVSVPVTLLTDVFANGMLETGIGATYVVNGSGQKLVTRGADVNDILFSNVRWHLLEGEPIDTILNVTFNSMDADSVQFYIERNIGPITLDSPVFATVPTNGRYLEVADADGATSVVVNVVNPTPSTHGGRVLETAGGLITGWLDFPAINWSNGSLDQDWFNPGNWAENRVPTATDSVIVGPFGSTDMPVVNGLTAFAGSLVSSGINSISVATELQVGQRLSLPTESPGIVCGTGVITLAGADTVSLAGRAACPIVAQNTVVLIHRGGVAQGRARVDSLQLTGSSALVIDNDTLQTDHALRVHDASVVSMQSTDGLLRAMGQVVFASSVPPTLSSGLLRISGTFLQSGSAVFAPSAAHATEFVFDPTYTASSAQFSDQMTSHFNLLRIAAPFDIDGTVRGTGNVRLEPAAVVTGSTGRLAITGALDGAPGSSLDVRALELSGEFADSGSYAADTTVFTGTGQFIPFRINEQTRNYESIRVTGSATMIGQQFQTYTMTGDLVIDGYLAAADSSTVVVTGSLFTRGSGQLAMNTSLQSALEVSGSAEFRGGSTASLLTQGTLRVRGSFLQANDNSTESFSAGAQHVVVLDSAGTLKLEGAITSGFGTLRINSFSGGSYTLQSNIRAETFETEGESSDSVRLIAGPDLAGATAVIDVATPTLNEHLVAENVALRSTYAWNNFASLTFRNFGTNATPQIEIAAPFNSLAAGIITFDTLQATPLYVRLDDTQPLAGLSDTLQFIVSGGVNPVIHGGNVQVLNGAQLLGWLADPEFRWTGALDNSWTTAGNWATGIVPTASDSAYVPSIVTNAPTISAPTTLRALVSDLETDSVYVNSVLTIEQQLLVPQTTGLTCPTGSVQFTGAGVKSVGGRINCGVTLAQDTTVVSDSTVLHALQITQSSHLRVTDDTLFIATNLGTSETGRLQINGDNSLVTVFGNAAFNGGGTGGFINRGRLRVGGTLSSSSTGGFSASFLHTTEFFDNGGEGFIQIQFSDPDNSRFNAIEFTGGDRQINGRVIALGNVTVSGGVFLNGDFASRLELMNAGAFVAEPSSTVDLNALHIATTATFNGTLQVDTVVFVGAETQTVPAYNSSMAPIAYRSIRATDSLLFQVTDTTVGFWTLSGDLVLGDSAVAIIGQAGDTSLVFVNGNFVTADSGRFVMQEANTTVQVNGASFFNGGSTAGLLTNGRFRARGDFTQQLGSPSAYSADAPHVTSLEGFGNQNLTFADPGLGAGASHFGSLDVIQQNPGLYVGLQSMVYVSGLFRIDTASASRWLLSTPTGYLTSYGGHVRGGLTLDNVSWRILNGFPTDTLEGLTFQNFTTDTLQLHITREDGVIEMLSPTFSTAGVEDFFRIEDGGGVSPLTVNVTNAQPPYHNFRADTLGGAIINGWPAQVEFRWTGEVNSDWSTPGNWSMDTVPTLDDTAVILDAALTNPEITSDTVYVGGLLFDGPSRQLRLMGDSTWLILAGGGSISAPATNVGVYCDSTATTKGVFLNGVSPEHSVRGRFACDVVTNSGITNVGDTLWVDGTLTVFNTLRLGAASQVKIDGARFDVQGTGLVEMSSGTSVLDVRYLARFAASGQSVLNGGTLRVGGDLEQWGTNGNLRAGGTHLTEFYNGDVMLDIGRKISFATPDSTGSYLHDVYFNDSRKLTTRLVAKGYASIEGTMTVDSVGTLEVHGVLVGVMSSVLEVPEVVLGGLFNFAGDVSLVNKFTFFGENQEIPFTVGPQTVEYDTLVVVGSAFARGTGTIEGSVFVSDSGELRFGFADTLTTIGISGDLYTATGGTIRMVDGGTEVTVGGSASFDGGSTENKLTAGILDVSVQFSATDSAFIATGTHEVVMTHPGDGTPAIWIPPGASRFNRLRLPSGPRDVEFGLRARILELTDATLSATPDSTIIVTDSLLGGGFSNFTATRLLLGGALAFDGGFSVDTVVFTGVGQLIPNRQPDADPVPYNHIRVSGDAQTSVPNTDSLIVAQSIVVNEGGNLRFGDAATSLVGAFALWVQDSATIEMTDALTTVRVGYATFEGGSTSGKLTAGTLEVLNTFTQDSVNSPESYRATNNHVTRLVAGASSNVTFTSPGDTAGSSQFAVLRLVGANAEYTRLHSDLYVASALEAVGAYPADIRTELGFNRIFSNGAFVSSTALSLTSTGWTLQGDGGTTLSNITFNAMPADSIWWHVKRESGSMTAASLAFNGPTPTGGGRYLLVEDVDGLSDLSLTITGVTPLYHGGLAEAINTASLLGWDATGPFIWTGAQNNQFAVAANWNANAVPTATDSVYFDSTATNSMEISSPTTLGALTMLGSGASVQLSQPVTITRSLMIGNSGAACVGSGEFVLSGTTTLHFQADTLNCPLFIKNGIATVEGTSVVEALTVSENGTLDLNGETLTVGNNFTVADTALLVMNDAADMLIVRGQALFAGASTTGQLTNGTLDVGHSFLQLGPVPTSFHATENHQTLLRYPGASIDTVSITFNDPGPSRFAFLTVDSTYRTVDNPVFVDSLLRLSGNAKLLVGLNNSTVTAMGGLSTGPETEIDVARFALRGAWVGDSGIFSPDTADFLGQDAGDQLIWKANALHQHHYEVIRIFGDARLGHGEGGDYHIIDTVLVLDGTLSIGAGGEDGISVNPTFSFGDPTAALIVSGPTARLAMDGGSDVRFRDVRFLDGTTDSTSLVFGKLYVYRHFEAAPATFSAGAVDPEAGDVHEVIMMGDSSSITLGDPEPARFYDLTFNRGSDTKLFSHVFINGRFGRGVEDSLTAVSIRSNVLNTVAPYTIHAFGGTGWGMVGSGYELTLQNVAVALYGSNDPAANGNFEFDDVRWEQMFPEATFLTVAEAGNYIGLDSAVFEGLQFNSGVTTGKYFEIAVQSTGANPEVQFQNSTPSIGCMNTVCQATDFEPGTPQLNTWQGDVDGDWHNAANWSQNSVPGENTNVLIPTTGVTFNPSIGVTPAAVRDLEVEPTRVLDLFATSLTVNGDIVISGSVTHLGGWLQQRPRNAVETFTLAVPGVMLSDYYLIAGPGGVSGQVQATDTVNSTANLQLDAGRFNVNGQKIFVSALNVTGTGLLQMTNAADSLVVSDGATFEGASTDGWLTAGVLDVGGSFAQTNVNSTEAFAASSGHLTILRGSAPQIIQFANGGPGSGSSHFGSVLALNGGNNKDVQSEIWATGAFQAIGNPVFSSSIGYTSLRSSGGTTAGVTFDGIRWEINPGEPVGTLQGIKFLGADPSQPQLDITRFGAEVIDIVDPEFDPVAFTGGVYFRLIDPETDGNLVANFSNVSPVGHEGAITLFGGAVMNGWGEFLVHVFEGDGADGSIQTLANWSNGVLPGAGDSVYVDNSGGTYTMVVDQPFAVRSLVLASNANISVQDTISASKWMRMYTSGALNCSGLGALRLNSAVAFGASAVDCDAVVEGTGVTQMIDSTRVVDLTIRGAATFGLGNQILRVTGDFVTADSGRVRLFGNNDSLLVSGSATFGGGSTEGQLTDGHMVFMGDLTVSGGSDRAFVSGPNLIVHIGNPSEVGGSRTVQFDHDTVSHISNLLHHAGTTTIADGSVLPVRDTLVMVDTPANRITGTLGARLRVGFDSNGPEYGFFYGSDQAVVTTSILEMYGQFYAGDSIKPDIMEYLGTGSDDNAGVQRVRGVSVEETSMAYKVLRIRGNAEIVDENYPVNPGLHVSQRLEVLSDTLRIGGGSVGVHVRADSATVVVSGSGVLMMQDDSALVVVDSMHWNTGNTSTLQYGEIQVRGAWVQRNFGGFANQYLFDPAFRMLFAPGSFGNAGNLTYDVEDPLNAALMNLRITGGAIGDTVTLASDLVASGLFKRDGANDGPVVIRAANLTAGNSRLFQVGGSGTGGGIDVNFAESPVVFRNVRLVVDGDAGGLVDANMLQWTADMDPDVTAFTLATIGQGPKTFSNIQFYYTPGAGKYFEYHPLSTSGTVTFSNPNPTVGCFILGCSPGDVSPFAAEPNSWEGDNSTSWTDPLNWSAGHVPDFNSSVTIPSGTTYSPTISTSQLNVGYLEVQSGATLTFGGFEVLYVRESLNNAGTITGANGSIFMGPLTGSILESSGDFEVDLTVGTGIGGVVHDVIIVGSVNIIGSLQVAGRLDVNGGSLYSEGLTVTGSNGLLIMQTSGAYVTVNGNASFSGGVNTTGYLTKGTIDISGNFTQSGGNQFAFAPSDSLLTIFGSSSSNSVVSFLNAGAGNSRFNWLSFEKSNSMNIQFTSNAWVNDIVWWTNTSPISVTNGTLTVVNTMENPGSSTIALDLSTGFMILENPIYDAVDCGPIGQTLNVTNPGNFLPAACVGLTQQLVLAQQGHQNQDESRWESLRQYVFRD